MKFSITDSIRNVTGDLVRLTEDIRNGKLHFLCSDENFFPLNIGSKLNLHKSNPYFFY